MGARLDADTGRLEPPTAVVGAGAEFTGTLTSGFATLALDVAGSTITLTVVNRASGNELNPDGVISLDWRRLRLSGLIDAAGRIHRVALVESSFPEGTFGRTQSTGDAIDWQLNSVRMPGKGTTWRAVWQIDFGDR